MQIWLIRHGFSRWNKERRHQGQSPNEPGLSPEGVIQAQKIAQYLKDLHISRLYSSPLQRAKETALAIYAKHGTSFLIQYESGLMEISHGEADGMLEDEISTRFPEGWKKWKEVVWQEPCFPRGESLSLAVARPMVVLSNIVTSHIDHEGIKVIVSHGTVLAGLITLLQGKSLRKMRENELHNGSISILDWDGENFRIDAVNMIGHLENSVMSGNISI